MPTVRHPVFRHLRPPASLTRRGVQVLTAAVVAAVVLASGTWQAASARPAEQMATVAMRDNFFQPEELTVPAGTTVTWANRGGNAHTATGNTGVWDSGTVQPDGAFSFTFTEPGTYPYRCELHASLGMVGTIVVEAAEPPTPTDEAPQEPATERPSAGRTTPPTAGPADPTAMAPGEDASRGRAETTAVPSKPTAVPEVRTRADAQVPPKPAPRAYVVQPGDTLFSIARRFGVPVTALARANNLHNIHRIFAGMRLVVPAVGGHQAKPPSQAPVYTVRPGDTVFSIARRHGASPLAVIRANRLVNPDLIFPGMRLLIPAARPMPAHPQPACFTYVVGPGDTVFGIAARFGTTIRRLVAANGIHPNLIFIGQPLLVCPGR